jgi:two-component system NtrC family sensor kinase
MDREKIKVLLIEDNPGDARLMQELLAEASGALFSLEHVDTLTKGLARLAQDGVDVILLDLSLPDSQGLEGLDKILAQTLSVPIVVLSGLNDEAVAIKAVQAGAQDYLVKGTIDANLIGRSLRYAIERQRLTIALRESEARYRLLADNIADVIWTADARARITYVSPSIKRLLGYTVEEAVKLQISDILTPDSLDQARKLIRGQMNMRAWGMKYPPASMTLEHIRKDGSTVWAEVMLSFMQSRDGRIIGIMGATRDITERKKAEEALRQSEERFRTIFEGTSIGIALVGFDMKVIRINPAFERMFGYSLEEFSKLKNLEYLHPDDAMVDAKFYLEMLEGKRDHYTIDKRYTRKDGKVIWGRQNLSVVRSADGKPMYFIAMIEDITERKHMEDALRQNEEKLRLYFQNVSDVIYSFDTEFRVLNVSPAVERLLGYRPEELVGRPFYELNLVTPASLELAFYDMLRVFAGEHVISYREFIAKDGTIRFGEISLSPLYSAEGKLIGALGVGRDVTERKHMEEALKESERNYRILFESSIDGMFVIDGKTMEILFANQTMAKISGFDSAQDLVGLNVFELVAPEERKRAFKLVKEDVFEKDLHRIHEYRAFTKDGREKWVSVVSTRIEYQGRMAALVSVRDITELKRAEEEKKKLEDQIQLAGRLAAVGELAAGIAHELNNPLAAIKGFAQLLAGREGLDESIKKDLQSIYLESQRASKITQNLLSFARRHEPEKRLISINEALEKTLELASHQLKVNNIELVTELAPDLPRTMADFHQMQEVFVNIITNAEQAMVEAHGKGRLIIRTKKVGGMVQITFTDDGPGISEENLKRIFDPFFTTKEVGKGTGLGLSICYGLVEAHGGRIYVKSKVGNGATFVVEIPIVSEAQLLAASSLNPGTGM